MTLRADWKFVLRNIFSCQCRYLGTHSKVARKLCISKTYDLVFLRTIIHEEGF